MLLVSLGFLIGAVIGDLKHSLFTVIFVALSYLASRVIVRTGRETTSSIGQPAPPPQ